MKSFKQFINENDSSYIDWEAIEEICMNTEGLPDSVPQNIRQWDVLIRQYERALDLVNGKWEPNYDWKTEEDFGKSVNEQFYLGKGFKNSIYECFSDLSVDHKQIFKNVDWESLLIAYRFTVWAIFLYKLNLTVLPLLPRKVGGSFWCSDNQLISLEGCPEYVGKDFDCIGNRLTSLKGGPKYVGSDVWCKNNKLPKNIPEIFPGKNLRKYIKK